MWGILHDCLRRGSTPYPSPPLFAWNGSSQAKNHVTLQGPFRIHNIFEKGVPSHPNHRQECIARHGLTLQSDGMAVGLSVLLSDSTGEMLTKEDKARWDISNCDASAAANQS